MVNPAASGEAPERALKDLRGRKVYIDIRLPRIRDEIKTMTDQRKTLAEESRVGAKPEGAKLKASVAKRIYTTHELDRLKAELASLQIERKTVLERLREARDKK
jgi:phage-related minor tail protein